VTIADLRAAARMAILRRATKPWYTHAASSSRLMRNRGPGRA